MDVAAVATEATKVATMRLRRCEKDLGVPSHTVGVTDVSPSPANLEEEVTEGRISDEGRADVTDVKIAPVNPGSEM